MSYYIYKYTNKNNEIVYIGQTQDLHKRIQNHKKELTLGSYEDLEIKYFISPNKVSTDIYEFLLIKKYKPIHNKTYNNNIKVFCTLTEEPEWIEYVKPETKFSTSKGNRNKPPLSNEEWKKRQLAGIAKAKLEKKI